MAGATDACSVANDEPTHLCCPITQIMYRDPVFVIESGNVYEREAILEFWRQPGHRRDPLTNVALSSDALYTNWDKRREVAGYLSEHPALVPQGWSCRDVPAPLSTGAQPVHPRWQSGRRIARCCPSMKTIIVAVAVGLSVSSGLGIIPPAELGISSHGGHDAWDDHLPPVTCAASPWGALGKQAPSAEGLAQGAALWDPDDDILDRLPKRRLLRKLHVCVSPAVVGTETDGQLLRIDLPPASFASLLSANLGFGIAFLAFTYVWLRGAGRANAPLPVLLFSCPFWFAGAMILSDGLSPLMQRSTLAVSAAGVQFERHAITDAESVYHRYGGRGFDFSIALLAQWERQFNRCAFITSDDLTSGWDDTPERRRRRQRQPQPQNEDRWQDSCASDATDAGRALHAALHEALDVRVTHVVNGVESGVLELTRQSGERQAAHSWGAGGVLSMTELHAVRELVLWWASRSTPRRPA